ncbi:MAG: DnaJ domain-containing protein [Desulfobulbaceae bacterium]|nr:DnaJ domain-containing protein [Desulfobulbaceae bacterium]
MGSDAANSPVSRLAQAFAGIQSTEELIIFVAGSDNMLALCRQLMERFDRDPHDPLVREADRACAAHGILPGLFFAEVRKVLLALNRFHDAGRDHYGVLGLSPGASLEEVKKAYRRLSKQYHPDKTGQAIDEGRRFMEISGAYHALMAGIDRKKSARTLPWREKKGQGPAASRHRSRNLFVGLMLALLLVLIAISIFLSAGYNRKAVISQLEMSKAAHGRGDAPAALAAGKEKPAGDNISADAYAPAAAGEEDSPPEAARPEKPRSPQADILAESHREAAAWVSVGSRDEAPSPESMEGQAHPVGSDPEAVPGQAPPAAGTENKFSAGQAEGEGAVQDRAVAAEEAGPEPLPEPETRSPPVSEEKLAGVEDEAGRPGGQVVFSREESGMASPGSGRAEEAGPGPARDRAREIDEFIGRYARCYNSRELTPFLALFTDKATENGQPLAEMTEQYRALFARTRNIRLAVLNLGWSREGEGFEARGDFRATYLYADGRSREHNGEITFHLVDDRDGMKISALEYVFLE